MVQVIGPFVHHLGASFQMESMVVCRTNCVAGRMRQLQLNVFVRVTLLMKNGRSKASESVARHTPLEAHSLKAF